MPVFQVRGPDNYVYKFNGPDDATADEKIAYAQHLYAQRHEEIARNQNKSLLGDIGTKFKQGVERLPGAAVGLVDIPLTLVTGKPVLEPLAAEAGEATGFEPAKWAEQAEEYLSPSYKEGQQAIQQAWDDKTKSGWDVAKAYLTHPGQIAGMVSEAVPMTAAAALTGGAAGMAAKATSMGGRAAAAGLGEAAVTAGTLYDQLIQGGESPENARLKAIAALGGGTVTGVIGGAGASLSTRLGITDPESIFNRPAMQALSQAEIDLFLNAANRGIAQRMGLGAVKEGLIEELPQSAQEQMWQNYAEGKPITEGVSRAAVEGSLAGSFMGAGTNLLFRGVTPEDVQQEVGRRAAVTKANADEIQKQQTRMLIEAGVLPPEVDKKAGKKAGKKADEEAELGQEDVGKFLAKLKETVQTPPQKDPVEAVGFGGRFQMVDHLAEKVGGRAKAVAILKKIGYLEADGVTWTAEGARKNAMTAEERELERTAEKEQGKKKEAGLAEEVTYDEGLDKPELGDSISVLGRQTDGDAEGTGGPDLSGVGSSGVPIESIETGAGKQPDTLVKEAAPVEAAPVEAVSLIHEPSSVKFQDGTQFTEEGLIEDLIAGKIKNPIFDLLANDLDDIKRILGESLPLMEKISRMARPRRVDTDRVKDLAEELNIVHYYARSAAGDIYHTPKTKLGEMLDEIKYGPTQERLDNLLAYVEELKTKGQIEDKLPVTAYHGTKYKVSSADNIRLPENTDQPEIEPALVDVTQAEQPTIETQDELSEQKLLEKLLNSVSKFTNPVQVRNYLNLILSTRTVEALEKENKQLIKNLFDAYKEQKPAVVKWEGAPKAIREVSFNEAVETVKKLELPEITRGEFNSAHPYLRSKSPYSEHAPIISSQGVKFAIADEYNEAYDLMDTAGYNKVLVKRAEEETAKRRKEREAKILDLVEKEGLTKRQAQNKVGNIKDFTYSSEDPLAYLSTDELQRIATEFLGKKTPKGAALKAQNLRRSFIESRPKEVQEYIKREVAALFRAEKVASTSARIASTARKKIKAAETREEEQDERTLLERTELQTEPLIKGLVSPTEDARIYEQITTAGRIKVNGAVSKAISQHKSAKEILDALAGSEFDRDFNYQSVAKYLSHFLHRHQLSGDVRVVFGKISNGRPGQFNPKTKTITIDRDNLGSAHMGQVLIHEMMHYAVDHLIDNYTKLTAEQKAAVDNLRALYNRVKATHLSEKFDIGNLKEFVAEAFSNREFQKALAQIETGKTVRSTMLKDIVKVIVEAVRRALPGVPAGILSEVIDQVDSILSGAGYKPPTLALRGKGISYAPLQAGPAPGRAIDVDKIKERNVLTEFHRESVIQKVKRLFWGEAGIDRIIKNLANSRHHSKKWERQHERAGLINVTSGEPDNVHSVLMMSQQKAVVAQKTFLDPLFSELNKGLVILSKAMNKSMGETLGLLHVYSEAFTEQERRHIKFLKCAPLEPKAAAKRDAIFDYVAQNRKISHAGILALRAELENIVANNLSVAGVGAYKTINEQGSDYNVTESLNSQEVAAIIEDYNNNPHKALIDDVLGGRTPDGRPIKEGLLRPIMDATIALNREGNYWSQSTDNLVDFYNWDFYVPLKAKSEGKMPDNTEFLNLYDHRLSAELKEYPHPFIGEEHDPEKDPVTRANSIRQVMIEASKSAMRAGRKDLTETIMNAIKHKIMPGDVKSDLHYTAEQVYKGLDDKAKTAMKNRGAIIHHGGDGSMQILNIKDDELVEAIRRSYKDSHPLWDSLNNFTSLIGQGHTRYNPSFPLIGFLRDVFANTFLIATDFGPKMASKVAWATASQLATLDTVRLNAVVRAYNRNDMAKVQELAAKGGKDSIAQLAMEYITVGGPSSIVAGLTTVGKMEGLYKELKGSKVLQTKEQIDRFFDGFLGTFELAARVAAYKVLKSEFMSRGATEEAAIKKAAVVVKNLANFEEVGEYGKQAGALFIFFRPSAMGANRVFESLEPALRSWKNVEKNLPDNIKKNPQALATYKANWQKQSRMASGVMLTLLGAGAFMYLLSMSMAGEDDEDRNKVLTDDLSRWTRVARFDIGEDKMIQIPWGFGLGGFMAMGAQFAGALTSKQNSMADIISNVANIALDSYVPMPVSRINMFDHPAAFIVDSATPSFARPMVEYVMNLNAYGQEIYNDRYSRYGDAYSGAHNVPDMYKDAARWIVDNMGIDMDPNTAHFLASNYLDGLSRVLHNSYGAANTVVGRKDFDAKKDLMFLEGFISNRSLVDEREFRDMRETVEEKAKMINMLKSNPEVYARYVEENPMDLAIVSMYNHHINGTLKDLRAASNKINRMPGLTPKERKEYLDENRQAQNMIKRAITAQVLSLTGDINN